MALRLWADSLATESVGIADETDPTEVNHGKLRVDTRLKVAGVLDRKRFGTEKVSAAAPLSIHFDAALQGAALELLGRIRQPLLIEQEAA